MLKKKTLLGKHYLLIIYAAFLLFDCFLLYKAHYNKRIYSKTLLMPLLSLWFMANTAFNIKSTPATLTSRIVLYFFLVLTWFGDLAGLNSDEFIWRACLIIYSITYILALIVATSIQINLNEEKKFIYHYKTMIMLFLSSLFISFAFIYNFVGFENIVNTIWMGAHCLIICAVVAIIGNMSYTEKLKPLMPIFISSAFFLILTNIIYGFDELYFHRINNRIDVLVAISNGLFQVTFIFGVMKFIRIFKKQIK